MAESMLPRQAGWAGQAGGQSAESLTEMSALAAATFFGVYTALAARRLPAKLKL